MAVAGDSKRRTDEPRRFATSTQDRPASAAKLNPTAVTARRRPYRPPTDADRDRELPERWDGMS